MELPLVQVLELRAEQSAVLADARDGRTEPTAGHSEPLGFCAGGYFPSLSLPVFDSPIAYNCSTNYSCQQMKLRLQTKSPAGFQLGSKFSHIFVLLSRLRRLAENFVLPRSFGR
jgi:hypothetical protein